MTRSARLEVSARWEVHPLQNVAVQHFCATGTVI